MLQRKKETALQRKTAIVAIAVVIALTVAAVVMIPGVLALLETITTIQSSGSVSKFSLILKRNLVSLLVNLPSWVPFSNQSQLFPGGWSAFVVQSLCEFTLQFYQVINDFVGIHLFGHSFNRYRKKVLSLPLLITFRVRRVEEFKNLLF